MSRAENPELFARIYDADGKPVRERPIKPAEAVAVVRRGVESGEIEASEIECFFCEGMGEVVHDIDCEQCALDGGLKHAHACPECRGAGGLRVVVIGPDGGL